MAKANGSLLWITLPHISLLPPLEVRVLGLQPCPCPAAHVARADALRHDAFEVHPARMTKDGGHVTGDRLANLDAVARGLWSCGTAASYANPEAPGARPGQRA